MSQKAYIILNPTAGGGSAPGVDDRIVAAFHRENMPCDLVVADSDTDVGELAGNAHDLGYSPIVAAGGDGTVNEVVNGLVHTGATLGILPLAACG